MPVLFNKELGAVETVAPETADQLLQTGSHEIPLNDPDGNPVSAPVSEAASLMQQGYTQPHPEQLTSLLEQAKYGSGEQQAIAATEGAASALTFGASTAAEQVFGVRPYDIRKRQEHNPATATTGEVAGLVAGTLLGAGAPALIEKAGLRAAELASKAAAEGAMNRIGSMSVRAAVENAAFQSGNEVSKMFMGDPTQTVETAAADIGLSGLLGAGLGAGIGSTSEFWKATAGKKIDSVLSALRNRSTGLPVELKTAANIDLSPEIEAALGDNPQAKQVAAELFESQTKAGAKYQQAIGNFKTQASDALGQAFGKTSDDITDLQHLSGYETGKTFQRALSDEIAAKVEPISAKYDEITEKFEKAVLSEADKSDIANRIASTITEQGLDKGPNEAALKLANKVLEQLPKQQTVQDLRAYAQGLRTTAPFGSEQYQIGKVLRSIFNDAQDTVVGREAGNAGLADIFRQTQSEYSRFKGLLGDLNDRLHLGREGRAGASTFSAALRSMEPEAVVKRLGLKDDVSLQQLLQQQFPQTAELAKQQEISGLLKKTLDKNGNIDPNKLVKAVKGLSPELKGYLISPEATNRIEAIQNLLNRMPQRMNPSGTAKTLDALWSKVPASGAAMVAMLTGNNPILGAIIGQITHSLGREVPDAVKLAMLKYMGSSAEISASGLKAAASLARKTISAEKKLDVSAKEVFGGKVADIKQPSSEQLSKLKKQVDEFTANPEKLMDQHDHTGHYLPEHGAVISMTAARNLQYLATVRPNTAPLSPFSGKQVASNEQEGNYNNALQIAEAPLIVMPKVKDGSITQQDLQHLRAMYPALYQRMGQKLQQQMIEASKDGEVTVPYKTQIGLSVFMGAPLTLGMTPIAIQSTQNRGRAPSVPGLDQRGPSSTGSGSRLQKLDKMPGLSASPGQMRQMNRAGIRH